jgi:hypothetical protein
MYYFQTNGVYLSSDVAKNKSFEALNFKRFMN